jgi:hypothetical protein
MSVETTEYSVCVDCWLYCGDADLADHDAQEDAVAREIAGRDGSFTTGVAQTEDDPEGTGYEEFSRQACELCNSTLGGSRHGVTLVIQMPDPPKRKPTCADCGGDEISVDATARWDEDSQSWDLADTHDAYYCDDCDKHMKRPVWVDVQPEQEA